MTGIYIIRNLVDGKVYIGQSVDLVRRVQAHQVKLKKGKHPNTYLQHAVDKFGYENFEFDVLEECNAEELDKREKYWIAYFDSMNRDKGYNRESGGNEGRVYSEDRKLAISGEGNPMYGRHQSKEYVEWIRQHNQGINNKLTKEQVMDIKISLCEGKPQSELAEKYQVSISAIDKIHKGRNWSWVLPELNSKMIDGYVKKTYKPKGKRRSYVEILKKDTTDRDNTAIKLFQSGASVKEVQRALHIGEGTAYKILKEQIAQRAIEIRENREDLMQNVVKDFKAGLPKEVIMAKYDISSTTYVRFITDAYNERKRELISECKRLRAEGFMVKDIANMLGIHRTTVTEYCKK